MSLSDTITNFKTGTYVVTRTTVSSFDGNGKKVGGTVSTHSIDGSLQPATGRELRALPESRRGDEIRVLYTIAEIKGPSATFEPDMIEIDDDDWEVIKVEYFAVISNHYRSTIARRNPGQ